MDSVHQRVPKSTMTNHKKGEKGKRKDENSLKVVYISSPMKVRTSMSRFRSLVQHLTGKNSDIARYMDTNRDAGDFHNDDELLAKELSGNQVLSSISSEDTTTTTTTAMTTPTTSDSFLGPMDNVFNSQMEEQFAGIYSSESFCDPSQLDVLGCYDDII